MGIIDLASKIRTHYFARSVDDQAELNEAANELVNQLRANPTMLTVIGMNMPALAAMLREVIAE